jgi:hypothetical protein
MAITRVTLTVHGFTEAEVQAGLTDLLDEFRRRDWIVSPSASWDVARKCLVISAGYDCDDIDGCRLAAKDEVWDCVIACLQFSSEEISFTIEDASYAPAA